MTADIATITSFTCLLVLKFVDLITPACLPEQQSPSSIAITNL